MTTNPTNPIFSTQRDNAFQNLLKDHEETHSEIQNEFQRIAHRPENHLGSLVKINQQMQELESRREETQRKTTDKFNQTIV